MPCIDGERELEYLGQYRYQPGENGPARPCSLPAGIKSEEVNRIAALLKAGGKTIARTNRNGATYEIRLQKYGGWEVAQVSTESATPWEFI